MADGNLRCVKCGRSFAAEERVALISGKVMGDECTDVYYWCEACGVYSIRLYRDAFLGEETSSDSKPIPREEGDRRLALIGRCPEPWNERCRCEAHREYFGGWLD
jgi:hypothetical protein